jgi:gamma-glutamyltranspeptidase / glutathione hydrolase
MKNRQPLATTAQTRPQGGTVNLSVADRAGNLVALTLTHGEAFGARVTVEGLGLTLGHGLSRFEPGPGHPNSPGPRKRPLHNMCPTIVSRAGRPVLALGGAGGRRIPNSLFEVLTQIIVNGVPFDAALAAPRLHTEGDLTVRPEKAWPAGDVEHLKSIGYQVVVGNSAKIGAASFDPLKRACHAAWR